MLYAFIGIIHTDTADTACRLPLVLELVTGDNSLYRLIYQLQGQHFSAICSNLDTYHCIASTTYSALSSITDDYTDQLAFHLMYPSHMVQAIYQALQSSASLGSCFWINPWIHTTESAPFRQRSGACSGRLQRGYPA